MSMSIRSRCCEMNYRNMLFDPTIHHRRSIRLNGYDYSQEGLYFVTICCHDKTCYFGKIENREMVLNDFGKIANDEWKKLPERYANVLFDVFQIMPNHVHGVIATVGAGLAPALASKSENVIDKTRISATMQSDCIIAEKYYSTIFPA